MNSKLKRFSIKPDYIYKKVEDIPQNFFSDNNIKLVMFDMDNTLVNNKYVHTDKLKKWFQELKKSGIKLYILTNSTSEKKVKKVAKDLGLKYYHRALKPFSKSFYEVIKKEKVEKEYVLMIGDQLFTDILGGNRIGIKTLLVEPIDSKENVLSKIKRPIEKILLKRIKNEREVKK